MDFSKEITVFESEVHKKIYENAREITPLDISVVGIEDKTLLSSCKAYYYFIFDMLSDMYENALEYDLPVMKLENFIGDKKINAMKQKYPAKVKILISQTVNSVCRYITTLFTLAFHGEVKDNSLIISSDLFPAMEKALNTKSSPISFEKRLYALSRIGLKQTDTGFISERYPDMFYAMCALAKSTNGRASGFGFYNFEKVDFRNIAKPYKPSVDDYFRPLNKVKQNIAFLIDDIARTSGCNSTISTFLKVDYKYKGAQVMLIDTYKGDLKIRITQTYSWDNSELINKRLESENDDFQKYALRHLWRCTACSSSHLGQFVYVLGKKNRVCGGGQIGFSWSNPSEDDLKYIQKFIKIRCDIIDSIKSNNNFDENN